MGTATVMGSNILITNMARGMTTAIAEGAVERVIITIIMTMAKNTINTITMTAIPAADTGAITSIIIVITTIRLAGGPDVRCV